MEIKKKVVRSTIWIFGFQIIDQGLGFLRLLILARLLTPTDMGLIGVAWLILQIISTFTESGIKQSLIHNKKLNNNYLNTSWTILLIRGIIIYCIVFLLSPIFGWFFNNNNVILLTRILCLALIMEGFNNIDIIYYKKTLNFKKQFIYDITGSLLDFISTIIAALILKSYWAIVIGTLLNFFIKLIMSYILSSYRPQFYLNKSIIFEISNYGKWIAGSNIFTFLFSQGDDLIVGRMLGTNSLGLYQLAYKISNMPATQVTHIISTVMFPTYAHIQDDLKRLSQIYLQTFELTLFLSFFVGTGIILFAHDFISLFLGPKWLPMVTSMQLLTIWGVLRSIGATTGPLWQAVGKPKIVTKIQALQVGILAVLILPLTISQNIEGTSLSVVIAALIPNIIAVYAVSRTTYCTLASLLSRILFPTIISIIIAILFYYLKSFIFDSNIVFFILLTISYVFLYITFTLLIDKIFHLNFVNTLFNLLPLKALLAKYLKI